MQRIRVCEDLEECRQIWEKVWPQRCFFDLWQVRECFASSYKRAPYFLVAEMQSRIEGLVALSRIDENRSFMCFPGETWKDKTWLEQNKMPVRSSQVLSELLEWLPGHTHLRYLTRDAVPMDKGPVAVDEIGYLFFPGNHAFSFQDYLQSFSGKSRKKLARELAELEKHGVAFRYDNVADIQWMFRMNLESFQDDSYFYDPRFLDSMDKLVTWLHGQGMLRVTTVLLGGVLAAVDIGAVWNRTYTVLAGATNPVFPGVAKLINFHHLEWSCQQRMEVVDFLCGDFGWKQRFHLTGRPLYEMKLLAEKKTGALPPADDVRVQFCEQ